MGERVDERMDEILVPACVNNGHSQLDEFFNSALSTPFHPEILGFTQQLSEKLLLDCRDQYPDLIALAYWCRSSQIKKIQSDFYERYKNLLVRPKGTVFQLAPGNVDALFLYSGLVSLLMGNRTIIRVTQDRSEQLEYLLKILNNILSLDECSSVASRFMVIHCGHDSQWIKTLSQQCDIRVIWGGDETIHAIRRLPLSPRAKELSFADRSSLCVLNAEAVCRCVEGGQTLDKMMSDFRRDVLSYSQQACSSPKAIVWQGKQEDIKGAKQLFWAAFEQSHSGSAAENSSDNMQRLVSLQAISIKQALTISKQEGELVRASVSVLTEAALQQHTGNGLILELQIENLTSLPAHLNSRMQTLSYWGYDRGILLQSLEMENCPYLDRIVPLGQSLDFELIWDGYDLLYEFCKVSSFPGK